MQLLVYRTYLESWKRGEKYADDGAVKIISSNDKFVLAEVAGSKIYQVKLEFRANGLSRSCSCPVKDFCKHLVAVAICWDESRGIRRPDADEVKSTAVPPPLVSRAEINKMYDDPLNVDLEILRLASESGNWSRPHARLPIKPKFSDDANKPLAFEEIKKAFNEIRRWTDRKNYDYYFCAGEMVAAFCETLRMIKKRATKAPIIELTEILLECQRFDGELIMELIDDSNGEHMFSEAHLEDLYCLVKKLNSGEGASMQVEKLLKRYQNNKE